MMRSLLFTCSILLSQFHVTTQDVIECDRPDQTETPSIVPDKFVQMENGFYVGRDPKWYVSHPASLIKYGIKDIVEVRLEVEPVSMIDEDQSKQKSYAHGIAPIALGLKLKVCEESKHRPKISVIVMSSIPVAATKGLTTKYPEPEIRFAFQHSLPKKFSVSYNAGISLSAENFMPNAFYTATIGYTAGKFGWYAEVFGNQTIGDSYNQGIDGGCMYYPINNVMLDISAGYTTTFKSSSWFTGLGISFRLPR